MEGLTQKPTTNPPQGNRGKRSRNTQEISAKGTNQTSGLSAIARTYATRKKDVTYLDFICIHYLILVQSIIIMAHYFFY